MAKQKRAPEADDARAELETIVNHQELRRLSRQLAALTFVLSNSGAFRNQADEIRDSVLEIVTDMAGQIEVLADSVCMEDD